MEKCLSIIVPAWSLAASPAITQALDAWESAHGIDRAKPAKATPAAECGCAAGGPGRHSLRPSGERHPEDGAGWRTDRGGDRCDGELLLESSRERREAGADAGGRSVFAALPAARAAAGFVRTRLPGPLGAPPSWRRPAAELAPFAAMLPAADDFRALLPGPLGAPPSWRRPAASLPRLRRCCRQPMTFVHCYRPARGPPKRPPTAVGTPQP